MDGTLLPGTTSNLEIAKVTKTENELHGLEDLFSQGKINTKEFAQEIYKLWGMLDGEIIKRAFDSSFKLSNIKKVIKKLKMDSNICIIITMSPDFFANHFFSYGFDYIFASQFPKEKHESLDISKILEPRDKPQIVLDLCEKLNLTYKDSIAFGDSMSDYYLFKELEYTVSVNGDSKIQERSKFQYEGNDLEELFIKFGLFN